MAGVEGFEPTTNGLTVRCATAAPHPSRCESYIYKWHLYFCLDLFIKKLPTKGIYLRGAVYLVDFINYCWLKLFPVIPDRFGRF